MKLSALIFLLLLAAVSAAPPTVALTDRTITLQATADGTQPFTYQWHRNGVAIPGATAAQLVITDPKATGAYHCLVANSAGSTRTPSVRLANTTVADAAEVTVTRKAK